MANFLEQTYPELRGKIEGENYPPPPIAELMSNILSALQLFALLYIFIGGQKILRLIGYRHIPAWYETVQNNTLQIGILLFLILPQVLAKWLITGAFEIYLDDNNIWSKIQTGRFPQMEELISIFSAVGLKKSA